MLKQVQGESADELLEAFLDKTMQQLMEESLGEFPDKFFEQILRSIVKPLGKIIEECLAVELFENF